MLHIRKLGTTSSQCYYIITRHLDMYINHTPTLRTENSKVEE